MDGVLAGGSRTRRRAQSRAGAPRRRLPRLADAVLNRLRGRSRARLAALLAAVLVPLLIGGWLWLRTSPLVSVESVRIEGVHGREAAAIEAALTRAARRMTTLAVHASALRGRCRAVPRRAHAAAPARASRTG